MSLNIAYELENLPPEKAEQYRENCALLTGLLNAELADSSLLTAVPFLVASGLSNKLAGGTFSQGILIAGRKLALTEYGKKRIKQCADTAKAVDQ